MQTPIVIDGSAGEGGGQILRTSLALSLVTGQPFRIEKIRAGRQRPGLLRQHLTAVNAATEVSRARVDGAELGSQELTFRPGAIRPGVYRFAIGSAGSATLVFQTIFPALMTASGPSKLTLEGGTHNPLAPPFDFLAKTFLPMIDKMGPRTEVRLERAGFYPAGGGKFEATITPAAQLNPLEITTRGDIRHRKATVLLANLPSHIAEREIALLRERLPWPEDAFVAETNIHSPGPGNAVLVEVGTDEGTEVFSGFGQKGVRAETVISDVIKEVRAYLAASVPVGEYLADQLLLPLALAGSGTFLTVGLSRHSRTNMDVITRFLPVKFETEELGSNASIVKVIRC
ncbi:RNA 3'-terminal phosphate cyclase [Verrucomicrobiota bacterium sgz303538]